MKIRKISIVFIFLAIGTVWFYQSVINNEIRFQMLTYLIDDIVVEKSIHELMLGSSSIKRLDHNRFLKCGHWLNRGMGNSTIADLINYISITPFSIKPQKILMYAGENDISRGIDATEVVKIYKILIHKLLVKYPESEIHIIAIKPSPKRQAYWSDFSIVNIDLENYLREISRAYFHPHPIGEDGFSSKSFLADGIHLTDQGYIVFTSGTNKTCQTN
jgi:hypothetical protein